MPTLSPQSLAVLNQFRHESGVTTDQANNLEAAINASPALIDQFNAAVSQGHLRKVVPMAGVNAGGQYDGANKAMEVPLIDLTTTPTTKGRKYHRGDMIFVLGHELQHGFNHAASSQAQAALYADARQIVTSSLPQDYTAAVGKLLATNRSDEAKAQIAGWNALVSAVKDSNPHPTLQDIYTDAPGRMRDFIDTSSPPSTYTLKPNLNINPDYTLSPTPTNVEAMGKNYFDKSGIDSKLGPNGNSDYANLYGAYAVSVIAHERRKVPGQTAPIELDFGKLRLNEVLMEENGIDLGAPGRTMPYVDTSAMRAIPGRFDHTKGTYAHMPVMAPSLASTPRGPDDANHPDHAMLQQIRDGVRKIDEGIGKPYDDMSERISRSLLAACKDNRDAYPDAENYSLSANALSRVDHVAMGGNGNIFAVEGRLDDPAHKRAFVSTQEAIQMPVEQSDQKLQAAHQAIAQEQQLAQQQAMSREVEAPSLGGFSR